jgi:hypothetical protein
VTGSVSVGEHATVCVGVHGMQGSGSGNEAPTHPRLQLSRHMSGYPEGGALSPKAHVGDINVSVRLALVVQSGPGNGSRTSRD